MLDIHNSDLKKNVNNDRQGTSETTVQNLY